MSVASYQLLNIEISNNFKIIQIKLTPVVFKFSSLLTSSAHFQAFALDKDQQECKSIKT